LRAQYGQRNLAKQEGLLPQLLKPLRPLVAVVGYELAEVLDVAKA